MEDSLLMPVGLTASNPSREGIAFVDSAVGFTGRFALYNSWYVGLNVFPFPLVLVIALDEGALGDGGFSMTKRGSVSQWFLNGQFGF